MIERFTLKNGIPVFVVESHASPVVSVQAWVSRGSVYETPEVAGISHFLEHALFKGTKKRKVGEIALEIESRGGEINAFTSFEETCYYTTLASRYFEDGLDVIADAIQNPLFDADEMEREKEVILEEIKRAQDSPMKVLSTNLWKTAFDKTPYGRPVLGFVDTVNKIDHKKLRKYFDQNYHAGTISLFIVGDVNKQKVKALAEKKLAKLHKGKKASIPAKKAAKTNSVRIICSEKDVQECHLQLAWIAPNIHDPKIPPLDLMSSAVGAGESSRLYQYLVKEKKVALEAHMGLAATAQCGLAAISLEVSPENLEIALKETLTLLETTAAQGLQEKEIERVKSSSESDVVAGKETVEGYARRLGYYYIQFGDPEYEKKYLESVLSVTRDEATKSLVEMLKAKPILSIIHPKNFKVDEKKCRALFDRELSKPIQAAPEAADPVLRKSNGMRFVEKVVTSLPVVAVRILLPGGNREEEKGQYGISSLFQRMWSSGTRSYSSLQLAHTLESLGASIHTFCGRHTLGMSTEFLSKHWPIVKPLISEILLEPTFPENEFQTEKHILLREIMAERDSPGSVCHLNFVNRLYGNHPYGRSSLGKKEDVEKLTTDDLKTFYKNYVHQRNIVISSVGNFDKDTWEDEFSKILGQLPKSGKDLKTAISVPEPKEVQVVFEKKEPLFQTHILVGFLGSSFKDTDRYALKLLSSCLAGQGGRLFLELRDKQSLAYQVAPISTDTPERGVFGFYIGCSPEKLNASLSGIRKEIQKVLDAPMSSKELSRAKEYWIGRFELEMQRFGAQAMLYGLDETYGLGYLHYKNVPNLIKEITAEDIQEAAQKHLKVDRATISVVHNQEIQEEFIHRAWKS